MNSNITLAYAMFTILLVPLTGATLLVVCSRLRKRHRPRLMTLTRILLLLLATTMLAVSLAATVAIIGWGLHADGQDNGMFASLLADSMMLFLLAVIAWGGLLALRLGLKARSELTPTQSLELEERLGLLQVIAWCLVGLPLLFVAPLAIPICVIPFILIEGPASAKRAKQGHLLWLLAIAVRRQQPLPQLLTSYSESLGGAHAFSIWRYFGFRGRSRFRTRIRHLADRLRDGISLADALEDSPGLLPRSTVVSVRVGHEAGCLAEALERAALMQSRSLRQTGSVSDISTFFIYAAAVLCVTISFVLFQMVFIVPKTRQIFSSFDVELPEVTMALINTSDALVSHLLLAAPLVSLPCLLLLVFGISWFWGLDNMRLPWVTRLWPRLHAAGIFRSLSLALAGNRTLERALAIQIEAAHWPEVAIRLERVRDAVLAGHCGWAALRQERLINSREQAVLECSERLNNLPWALELMADANQRRLHRRVLFSYQAVRPMVIGALGLLVGFFCIAFFYPLVTLLAEQA
ncbi:MAG: type II secretion system F family protein [Planctomycetaceae bacterium]